MHRRGDADSDVTGFDCITENFYPYIEKGIIVGIKLDEVFGMAERRDRRLERRIGETLIHGNPCITGLNPGQSLTCTQTTRKYQSCREREHSPTPGWWP